MVKIVNNALEIHKRRSHCICEVSNTERMIPTVDLEVSIAETRARPLFSAIVGVRQVIRGSLEYHGHGPENKGIYLHTEVPKPVEMLDMRWGWTHIVGRKTGDAIAGFTR